MIDEMRTNQFFLTEDEDPTDLDDETEEDEDDETVEGTVEDPDEAM